MVSASDRQGAEIPTATAEILRALSHPVRIRISRALSRRGFARAKDLADELELPANQISFHLRVLADADLIEEAPEHARDRRDRVWRARPSRWSLGEPGQPIADEQLGDATIRALAVDHAELVQRVIDWAPEYVAGRITARRAEFTRSELRLTEEEFVALTDRIRALFAEVSGLHEPGDAGTLYWQIDVVAASDPI